MTKAGELMGVHPNSARVALQRAGIQLLEITPRAFAVDEDAVLEYIAQRGGVGQIRRGRPRLMHAQSPEALHLRIRAAMADAGTFEFSDEELTDACGTHGRQEAVAKITPFLEQNGWALRHDFDRGLNTIYSLGRPS